MIDLVFEGGGARGLALNGGVEALDERGEKFNRLVGTSAGAISATMVAAGYTGPELRTMSLQTTPSGESRMTDFVGTPRGFSNADLLSSTLGTFLQKLDLPLIPKVIDQHFDVWLMRRLLDIPGFANLYSLIEHGGFFSADGFVAWLRQQLDGGGRAMSHLTFSEMYARTGKHLSVVTTDTTTGTFRVLNHITTPYCPVLWGVRMSMSIPFFWPDVIWQQSWGTYQDQDITGHAFVDGGVVSNFSLRLLISDEPWIERVMGAVPDPESHVMGFWLDTQKKVPNAPPANEVINYLEAAVRRSKLFGLVERVGNAAVSGNDLSEVASHPELVCQLPVYGYGVTELNMSAQRINAVIDAGAAATRAWFESHKVMQTIRQARERLPQASRIEASLSRKVSA